MASIQHNIFIVNSPEILGYMTIPIPPIDLLSQVAYYGK